MEEEVGGRLWERTSMRPDGTEGRRKREAKFRESKSGVGDVPRGYKTCSRHRGVVRGGNGRRGRAEGWPRARRKIRRAREGEKKEAGRERGKRRGGVFERDPRHSDTSPLSPAGTGDKQPRILAFGNQSDIHKHGMVGGRKNLRGGGENGKWMRSVRIRRHNALEGSPKIVLRARVRARELTSTYQ